MSRAPGDGDPQNPSLSFSVGEVEAGQRIDVALAVSSGASRSAVHRWIKAGQVTVNGRTCRASLRIALGDEVTAHPPQPASPTIEPEAVALQVVYEDSDLLVVDKPAGLVVHPAPGHASGTLVNALLHHCGDLAGIGGVLRPGIVHRLDKGTSGLLVAAKNDDSHQALAQQFHAHSIERIYHAFVRGLPQAETGRIDRPIGRHRRDRKRMSVATAAGRPAQTEWRMLERFPAAVASHLEIRPETGRTHQIRVHLASIGLPILGDDTYGRAREKNLNRPALHATVLGFDHRGERMRFEAPLPDDLVGMCERMRGQELPP